MNPISAELTDQESEQQLGKQGPPRRPKLRAERSRKPSRRDRQATDECDRVDLRNPEVHQIVDQVGPDVAVPVLPLLLVGVNALEDQQDEDDGARDSHRREDGVPAPVDAVNSESERSTEHHGERPVPEGSIDGLAVHGSSGTL